MIRTISSFAFAGLYLIFGIPVLVVEYFIGKKNPQLRDTSSLRMVQWAFGVINRICGVKLTVIGHENVPTDEPVLYVANHNSYFDIMLTYPLCPSLTGYISKDSIERVPLLSHWMKRLHCLFMNRDDVKQSLKTILAGVDLIKNGISVCIFPEGTRGDSAEMIPFKNGSMKIAEKTGCPVIPIAISGTRDIIGRPIPAARPTKVTIQYGAPIYPNELSKEDKKALGRITQSAIQSMLDEVK